MEAKHTPGPWNFGEFELYPGAGLRFNISQAEGAAHTPHYSDVAQTITGEDLSIQEANARLIAAAPEMLEALRLALNALEEIGNEMTVGERYTNAGQYLLDSLGPVREAITKATS